MHELAVIGDRLVGQQKPTRLDGLPNGGQRSPTLHADLASQRFPPRTDAQDHPTRGQVIQRREGRREAGRVTGPAVDHPRTDLDGLGTGGKGRHGNHGVTDQSRVGLPHGFEAALFGVRDVLHRLCNGVRILEVDGQSGHVASSLTSLRVDGAGVPPVRQPEPEPRRRRPGWVDRQPARPRRRPPRCGDRPPW